VQLNSLGGAIVMFAAYSVYERISAHFFLEIFGLFQRMYPPIASRVVAVSSDFGLHLW